MLNNLMRLDRDLTPLLLDCKSEKQFSTEHVTVLVLAQTIFCKKRQLTPKHGNSVKFSKSYVTLYDYSSRKFVFEFINK